MIRNGKRKGEEQLEEKIPQRKNTLETLDSGESEKRHWILARLWIDQELK